MPTITPCLWFDDQAEEAANYYVSIFPNSKVLDVSHYGEGSLRPAGTVLMVTFELQEQRLMALNGGPEFQFTEAISMSVSCETQTEVDELWSRLSEGGEEGQCGWLKDRYGLSWQIVPARLGELLGDPDPARARSVMEAMLQMSKLDTAALERASNEAAA